MKGLIILKEKSQMSPKTKKILVGVGIAFGTVMTFLVSFILAFTLIVNPINFMTVGDADTVEENEKLKEQVQTLEDEKDALQAKVDKYKNSATSQPAVTTPAVTTPSTQSQPDKTPEITTPETQTPQSSETTAPQSETNESSGGFAPETQTSTGEETPEDVDGPVTVIDVSE